MTPQGIEILLIEDQVADAELLAEAFEKSNYVNNLSVVSDGVEALEYLLRKGPHVNAPRPDLILLDLNLPKKSGGEVLKEIKDHSSLKRIPVIIMTSSDHEDDVLKSYNAHANCYIKKPVDINEIDRMVKTLEDFWISIVTRPPN